MSLSWYFDTLHIFVLLDFIPWSTPSLFSTILYVRSALISVVLATVSLLPTSLTTPTNLHVVFVVRGVVIIDHTNTVICMYRAPRSIQPPFFAYLFLSQEHHMQELRVWFPPPLPVTVDHIIDRLSIDYRCLLMCCDRHYPHVFHL